MQTSSREDIDFLLYSARVEDFGALESLEAYHTLLNTVEDMEFQIKASESEFKGDNVVAWRQRIEYKRNRCLEMARRFSLRYRELKESGAQSKIEAISHFLQNYGESPNCVEYIKEIIYG